MTVAETAVPREHRVSTGTLALAGMVGPPLFLGVVVALTWLELDFMRALGWSPALGDDSGVPWPSSLALGDYGWLQVANFVQLGVAVLAVSVALRRTLHARLGPGLLAAAGVAFLLSAFRIDHGLVGGDPETWNGWIHALAFFALALALLAALFVLAWHFDRDVRWRGLGRVTLAVAVVALSTMVLNLAGLGLGLFYLFLVVVLAWLVVVSARAREVAR